MSDPYAPLFNKPAVHKCPQCLDRRTILVNFQGFDHRIECPRCRTWPAFEKATGLETLLKCNP